MGTLSRCVLLVFMSGLAYAAASETKSPAQPADMKVYEVNKAVSQFPAKEDFSTPESTYAVISRAMAAGDQGVWRRISVKAIADRLSPSDAKRKDVTPEERDRWLNALVKEVRIFRGKRAGVLAEFVHPKRGRIIDVRFVDLEDGKWLNNGEDYAADMEEGRWKFGRSCAISLPSPRREGVAEPQKYLAPFVEFLKKNAEDPKAFAMNALKSRRIVIMGEIHHRPRCWEFNASLVKDPAFPDSIGAIYMELPMNDQTLIDGFLAADKLDTKPVIEMLRDMLETGWPDKPILDFFTTVWQANRKLPPEKRLRIILADMQRPWKEILKTGDFRKYDVDRDQLMAENIVKDIKAHPDDKRNGLFIVGAGHAMKNMEYIPGVPFKSAGWHLAKELGQDKVFVFFPHTASMTNVGEVYGRLCLGLFESAFAELGNKPMAFPLADSPFGKEPFDAFPDDPIHSPYADGYDAYLYLGTLENEIFSPLIPGFYTGDVVKEIDQRYKLIYKKSWSEMYGREATAASYTEWMSTGWGKPRKEWSMASLGPTDAWHFGSTGKNRPRPVEIRKPQKGDVAVSGAVVPSKTVTDVAGLRIRLDTTGPWEWVAETDAEGRFTASMPPGRHRLTVYLPGNEVFDTGLGHANIEAREGLSDIKVKLLDMAKIRVKITDKSGKPVEGVLPGGWERSDQTGPGLTGTASDANGISTLYIYPGERTYLGAFDRSRRWEFVTPKNYSSVTPNSGQTVDVTVIMQEAPD